ncbi:putative AC transposase [Bienertia sinuspersici]
MKKRKNYKWQKNDETGTMARHLRSDHGLGPEGKEGSSGGGQAQLHGYASDMPGVGVSPNYEYFNRVALQPQYRRVPRNTLKRHTQQAYYAYKSYLMEMFRTYDGRVNLTSDTCTSTYEEPFVCVTGHWIDDDWLLQKRIICFEAMEEAHNGFNIKTRIVSWCKNFHLVDKLFSISLDNTTTNTRAMEFLKEDPSIKLLLSGSLMHVRCCAHILNLCVQEGLDELRTLLEPITGVIRWIRAARSAKRIFKHKCDEYGFRKKVIALNTLTRWQHTSYCTMPSRIIMF